uniref:Uncharacterized protein AlNc14C42G3543 n=1 Tax=Albugo laibachii Nc14 TaxID=890382 RepID=F0W9T9_9STRA|nr:conserved hypothetical protein [Albugo laibachii Nc14]|eukprot:CCA17907.1 conserved hypothetical protein [Albugo laibachii Nc14]
MPRRRNTESKNGGRKPRQYMRNVPTHSFRLTIIDHYEAHDMPATIERLYPGVVSSVKEAKRKSVYLWATSERRSSREIGTATTLPRDGELDLIKCMNGYRLKGAPLSAVMLTRKSIQMASEDGVSATAFTASLTWRQVFLRRHNLAFGMRTHQEQISPADISAKAADISSELLQRMGELGVDLVYNADQTTDFFEHIPTKTIEAKGTQNVWVRPGEKTKEQVTCMLLGDSFGNKCEPFLVFSKTTTPMKKETAAENNAKQHGFDKLLWIKMYDLQSTFGVHIYANATAWWNAEMSVRFLEYQFGDRRERRVSPILLLWDDLSAHCSERVRICAQEIGVVLMRVPPVYTSVCPRADVSWDASLSSKCYVLEKDDITIEIPTADADQSKLFSTGSADHFLTDYSENVASKSAPKPHGSELVTTQPKTLRVENKTSPEIIQPENLSEPNAESATTQPGGTSMTSLQIPEEEDEVVYYLRREDKVKMIQNHPAVFDFSSDGRTLHCRCGREVRLNPPWYILKFEQHLVSRNCSFLRTQNPKRRKINDEQTTIVHSPQKQVITASWHGDVSYTLKFMDEILLLLEQNKVPLITSVYTKNKQSVVDEQRLRAMNLLKEKRGRIERMTPDGKFVECRCGQLVLLTAPWSLNKMYEHWKGACLHNNADSLLNDNEDTSRSATSRKTRKIMHWERAHALHSPFHDSSRKKRSRIRKGGEAKGLRTDNRRTISSYQLREFHWEPIHLETIVPCPGLRNETIARYVASSFQLTGGSRPRHKIARMLFPHLFKSEKVQLYKMYQQLSRYQKLLLHDAMEAEALWFIDKDAKSIRSLKCHVSVSLSKGESSCTACSELAAHPNLRAAITSCAKRHIHTDANTKSRANRRLKSSQICSWLEMDFAMNEEYGQLLRDLFLIEIDSNSALNMWIDLAEMGIHGEFDSHPAMIGLMESMAKLKDKERRGVGMQNMWYSSLLDKYMSSLATISTEACEFFQHHLCGRKQCVVNQSQAKMTDSGLHVDDMNSANKIECRQIQQQSAEELLYDMDSGSLSHRGHFSGLLDENDQGVMPNISIYDMPDVDFPSFTSTSAISSSEETTGSTQKANESVKSPSVNDHATSQNQSSSPLKSTTPSSKHIDEGIHSSTSGDEFVERSQPAELEVLPCSGLRGDKVDNYTMQAVQIIGGSRPKYVIAKELFPNAFVPGEKIRIQEQLNDQQKMILSDAVFGECFWRVDKRGKCVRSLYCFRHIPVKGSLSKNSSISSNGGLSSSQSTESAAPMIACRACNDLKSSANFRSVLSRAKMSKDVENLKFLPSVYTESDPFLRKLSKNASFRALFRVLKLKVTEQVEAKKRITFWLRIAIMGLVGQFRTHPVFEALIESMVAIKDKTRRGVGKQNMRYAKPLDDFLSTLSAISMEAFEYFSAEFCGRSNRSQKIVQRRKLETLLQTDADDVEQAKDSFQLSSTLLDPAAMSFSTEKNDIPASIYSSIMTSSYLPHEDSSQIGHRCLPQESTNAFLMPDPEINDQLAANCSSSAGDSMEHQHFIDRMMEAHLSVGHDELQLPPFEDTSLKLQSNVSFRGDANEINPIFDRNQFPKWSVQVFEWWRSIEDIAQRAQ